MEFNFIKHIPNSTYLNVLDGTKYPRYICFKNKKTAATYMNFLSRVRPDHGDWRQMDLSKTKNYDNPNKLALSKDRISQNIFHRDLKIETIQEDEFDMMCETYTMSVMFCDELSLSINEHKIDVGLLSTQEFDSYPDPQKYIAMMNRIIEV